MLLITYDELTHAARSMYDDSIIYINIRSQVESRPGRKPIILRIKIIITNYFKFKFFGKFYINLNLIIIV